MSNIVQIGQKYYDFSTRNSSFLLTANELKTLGIKNFYFMLEVKNPSLGVQDIDPFKPNITQEEIGKIHIECKQNVWYWLRECARIPVRGASQPYSVELTRASCAVTWLFEHSVDIILDQPRQTWKTTISLLIMLYCFLYEYKDVKIPFMHLKSEKVIKNVEEFRDYVYALPPYMNPFYGNKTRPGCKSIKYDKHGTEIKIVAKCDSPETAMDALRGETLFAAMLDEWEFTHHMNSVLAGAGPAIISARKIAAKSGIRTCIIKLSTPGNLETEEGQSAKRIIDNTPVWTEQYYDLSAEALVEAFSFESSSNPNYTPCVYVKYTYKQLRLDENWLRAMYKEAEKNGELVEYRRGVLQERFRGADTILFREEDINYIREHRKEPNHEILLLDKYLMYVYNHTVNHIDLTSDHPYFDIELPYMVGIDPSTGSGRDKTAIIIVHPYTLEVAAELETSLMSPFDLLRVITKLAVMLPRCLFCPETNNIGKILPAFVQESKLEHRFYYDPQLDISKNAIIKDNNVVSSLQRQATERGWIGIYTTATVRKNMFVVFKSQLEEYHHLMVTKCLVDSTCDLIKDKTGKILARDGGYDDMVMAYNQVLYVHTYGQKLTRFGIDKHLCTYTKIPEIMQEYTQLSEQNVVNNLTPYEHKTLYEGQVLNDILQSKVDYIDEYGYRHSSYNDGSLRTTQSHQSSNNVDASYFLSINDY